jgi:hypothetical protein
MFSGLKTVYERTLFEKEQAWRTDRAAWPLGGWSSPIQVAVQRLR